MSDADLIDKISAALADRLIPALPISVDLWDMKTIAAYLKRSPDSVRERLACLPDFPRPIRLPSAGRAQALYKAREVIHWAESHVA